MKRTKNNKPDAILTADWHLREDQPKCRLDNFPDSQWKKVQFVADLQNKYECPVIHAGDLFHHWKPSPYLLSKTIQYLPQWFKTVYGNHDLPQHNLELAEKSGIYTLDKANKLQVIPSMGNWGSRPEDFKKYPVNNKKYLNNRSYFVWHVMTWKKELPFPNCTDSSAKKLLKKYPQFNLIVTGDNHKPFTEQYDGRLLVNPGSLTRQRASETHKPRVYLYYAATNTVEPVYLPHTTDVITREHLVLEETRNERIDAFVSKLNTNWKTELNFADNLKEFFNANPNIKELVKQIIYKAIDI